MARNQSSWKTDVTTICAVIALIVMTVAGTHTAYADKFVSLPNYDLPGNDLRSPAQDPKLKQLSLSACRKTCQADPKCKAYTYNKSARWCFLKTSMSKPVLFDGAISGVRASQQNAGAIDPKVGPDFTANTSDTNQEPTVAALQHKTAISAMPAQRAGGNVVQNQKPIPVPGIKNPAAHVIQTARTPSASPQQVARPSPTAIPEPPKPLRSVGALGTKSQNSPSTPSIPAPAQQTTNVAEKTTTVQKTKNPWQFSSMEAVLAEKSTDTSKTKTAPAVAAIASVAQTNSAATSAPTPAAPTTSAVKPAPAPTQVARLTPPQIKKPLVDVNKDAGYLKRSIAKHAKLQKQVQTLSDKYLTMYDKEKAGTKWIEVASLGMNMPMSLNKSQAQAVVLSKMRKDETLEKLQKQLAQIDKKTEAPYTRVQKLLPEPSAKELALAYAQKKAASKAFFSAKRQLSKYGDKLSDEVNQTWQLPSDDALRKLHRLARKMRRKRLDTLKANEIFANKLKHAIEKPITVQTF